MSLKYDITEKEGKVLSVTIFSGADSHIATPQHPNFPLILDTLRSPEGVSDESRLIGLFDIGKGIVRGFEGVTDRISLSDGRLLFDGDPLMDEIAQTIIRYQSEGHDFMPLARFLEKLQTNPNKHSVEHLFRWVTKHHFAIADDGDFYAYKSVPFKGNDFRSSNSGVAFVNGQRYDGKIPNQPGTIVSMPRSEVTFDPRQGCSTGLHVANWSFALGFVSGPLLLLKVNPRDVVSVPSESNDQKMRVCRYYVVREVQRSAGQVTEGALYVDEPSKTAKSFPISGAVLPGASLKDQAKARRSMRKRAKVLEFPAHYEDFQKKHWEATNMTELRWLAGEWGVPAGGNPTKAKLVAVLTRAARRRRQEIADYEASKGK